MKAKQLELLSPAKNYEFGKTAINFGADAVYIGAQHSARAAAGNSVQDIEKLCSYAHKFDAKVYVALNTILYENELKPAETLINKLYNIGADAIIIQDMGITQMNLPPIPLHVSTQAHNTDFNKIAFYEKTGFTRVILARELSLNQIAEINKNTNIELESFVHGALCVSYSGQCYMSAYIGGRSGNRGECAQTCRLKYDLYDSDNNLMIKDKHLLSLKDMNRAEYLSKMIDAGISSFKIEGRLKDQNYIKNITAFYRKKLDNILEKKDNHKTSSTGIFFFDFEPDAERTFNRRFTDYFLNGRKPDVTSTSPKAVGKLLGNVTFSEKNILQINTSEKITNGDGLCFFDKNDNLVGFNVNTANGNKITANKELEIKNGTLIFRNNDHNFNKTLDKIDNCRFIEIDVKFNETETGFEIIVNTSDNKHIVKKQLKVEKEPAKNAEKALENLKNQLQKTGGTIFKIKTMEISLSDAYFLPMSEINKLRRETLEELFNILGDKYEHSIAVLNSETIPYITENLDYKANISNSLAEKFYTERGCEISEKAFETSENINNKTLMTTKLCIKYNLNMCPKYHKYSGKQQPAYLKMDEKKFFLKFDCNKCEMNIISE